MNEMNPCLLGAYSPSVAQIPKETLSIMCNDEGKM